MTSSITHSPLFHLTKPLTRGSLERIRTALATSKTRFTTPKASGNAAVLIPLCNVQNTPGILFEVRGKSLRAHSGEVSFPGGRVDPTDTGHVHTALRETYEELGIPNSRIEILGNIGPPEINLRGDMVVWPVVGFIHQEASYSTDMSPEDPLPSCDLTSIRAVASRTEVDSVFHLPFSALTSAVRLRSSMFRGNRPYWTVGVADIVENRMLDDRYTGGCPPSDDDSEIGPGRYGELEIWGLSGWFLNLLLRNIEMCQ
ncbi:hypothetical protein PQX77_004132 [Marasmius sp. AFHP31]|nr:hypothetical protein PQX77_004132 [Marasmius sp. AFHP31]